MQMSVAGVYRLTLSLFPISFSASHTYLSIFANRKRTQFTLSHHFSLVHHSHGLALNQYASSKYDAKAAPSYNEGEMLDKNETNSKNKNPFVSEEFWFKYLPELHGFFAYVMIMQKLLKKLKKYGVSGILSYGILNTVYYTTAFLLVWFYVAPAPGNMGFLAAAERFIKVMAMVWAGSQVTKLIRIGGAVALAPIVDRGLSWFTVKFKFGSQGKAFGAIVGICLGLALMMFVVVTLLSA